MEFIKELLSEDAPKSKYVVFATVDNGTISRYIEDLEIIREFDENQLDELRQFIIYSEVLVHEYLFGRRKKDNKFKFIKSHFKDLGRGYNITGYEVMYYDELSRRSDVEIEFSKEDLDEIESYKN